MPNREEAEWAVNLVQLVSWVSANRSLVMKMSRVSGDSVTVGMYEHPDGFVVLVPSLSGFLRLPKRYWVFVRILVNGKPVYDFSLPKLIRAAIARGIDPEEFGVIPWTEAGEP